MLNAHLRFGSLAYHRRTEKTTTHFELHLDRFVGEVLPDPPRQAKAHFLSVLGSETQISALSAAIFMEESFTVEGPGVQPVRVCLERNAQCYRGSVQLADRKKSLRHLIGISEEFAAASANSTRSLLANSVPTFVWASLAQIHGLPGVPEWAEWFCGQLERHKAVVPLLGIGCYPVLVKGNKERFLSWLSNGVRRGDLAFPKETGPIRWPNRSLSEAFKVPRN
jgi:hypothetical protein